LVTVRNWGSANTLITPSNPNNACPRSWPAASAAELKASIPDEMIVAPSAVNLRLSGLGVAWKEIAGMKRCKDSPILRAFVYLDSENKTKGV